MNAPLPSSQPVLEAQAIRRRQREARLHRYRRAMWAGGALALAALLVAAVVVWSSDDDQGDATSARSIGSTESSGQQSAASTSSPSTTLPTTTVPTTTVAPAAAAPTGPAVGASPPPVPATSAAPPPAAVPAGPLALPPADQSRPPDVPVGLYRQGKVLLAGSVPDEATGAAFFRKAAGVLGEPNVTMGMKLDPRAPRGPMRVTIQEEFEFPSGSSDVEPKWEGLLNLGVIALQRLPEAKLVLTGYTDNVGSPELNQRLSEQRAQVVADFMVSRGIPPDRVIAVGRGSADPIADNGTPEGRLKNRRIEGTLEGIMP